MLVSVHVNSKIPIILVTRSKNHNIRDDEDCRLI